MTDKMIQNHEKTLIEHTESLGKLRRGQDAIADDVVKVKKNIGAIIEHIAKLEGETPEEPPEPPFSWYTYTSQDKAIVALGKLEQFVDTILVHIQGGILNDCWRRHPQVVDMLIVLADSYEFAWSAKAGVGARLDFYTRYLPEILRQVGDQLGTCSLRDEVHNSKQHVATQLGIDRFELFELPWRLERGNPPIPEVPDEVLYESGNRGRENEREEMNR